jgi:hypothetical protein
VNARRRNAEEALHVALGRWAPVDDGVGVDEREVLALLRGERRRRRLDRQVDADVIDGAQGAAMNLRHRVLLSPGERAFLEGIVRGGASRARRIKRAQILLAAADGVSIREMHRTIGASQTTICRAKRDFAERGLEGALKERPRIGAPRKLSMNEEVSPAA